MGGREMMTADSETTLAAPATVTHYRITDLGALKDGVGSIASNINDLGLVIGQADVRDGRLHAFIYSSRAAWELGLSGPGMIDLGTLGGTFSMAVGIDAAGRVVGFSETASGAVHAFVWPRGGALRDLGALGGPNSYASAILLASGLGTLDGQIVGTIDMKDGTTRAFIHSGGYDGPIQTLLGTLGGKNSSAVGVNRRREVTGDSLTAQGDNHAFLYTGGSMIDLGTLGGKNSFARAINALGHVAGVAETSSGAIHAFLFQDGLMKDLGTLGGAKSAALGINLAGQVVGIADTAGGEEQAFLYDGSMINLNSLLPPGSGWELTGAAAINDAGQITGTGVHSGVTRGFLMTPIT